jgi:catechol 2,3-dioxygenase-like lactoylglutathione lyase family enzyme
VVVHGVHHVALICSNLEASLAFYTGVLGAHSGGGVGGRAHAC